MSCATDNNKKTDYLPGVMAEKQITFNITDNKTFFADEVSITNNPVKIIIDFKNTAPRIDIRAEQQGIPLVIEHNAIMMDTWLAKQFYGLLGQHLKKYEAEFGKITEPEQIQKAKKAHPVSTTKDKPGYFG